MDTLKLKDRIESLIEQHRALDKKIETHYTEYKDDTSLKQEKYQRLRLKSEIEQLQRQLTYSH